MAWLPTSPKVTGIENVPSGSILRTSRGWLGVAYVHITVFGQEEPYEDIEDMSMYLWCTKWLGNQIYSNYLKGTSTKYTDPTYRGGWGLSTDSNGVLTKGTPMSPDTTPWYPYVNRWWKSTSPGAVGAYRQQAKLYGYASGVLCQYGALGSEPTVDTVPLSYEEISQDWNGVFLLDAAQAPADGEITYCKYFGGLELADFSWYE